MHDSSKRLKTHHLRVYACPPVEEGVCVCVCVCVWVALHYVACTTQQLQALKKSSNPAAEG